MKPRRDRAPSNRAFARKSPNEDAWNIIQKIMKGISAIYARLETESEIEHDRDAKKQKYCFKWKSF